MSLHRETDGGFFSGLQRWLLPSSDNDRQYRKAPAFKHIACPILCNFFTTPIKLLIDSYFYPPTLLLPE